MSEESKQNKIVSTGRTGEVGTSLTGGAGRHIKIGRHGADMMMTSDPAKNEKMLAQVGIPTGVPTPQTMEERVKLAQKLISQSMGITIAGDIPNKIGFDISTDSQRKLLFGVLKSMSDTEYQGSYQVPNNQILKQQYKENSKTVEAQTKGYLVSMTQTHLGGAYENIPSYPVLKITDRDLMIVSGFDPDSHFDRENFKKAKGDLCFKQNFLMWTRFARDEKGHIKRNRNGKTEFELVSTFSPVLNLNVVSDPQTKQILYNEIALAPVFLDEISRDYGGVNGGYFILIPEDSTKEISKAYRQRFPTRKGLTPSVVQALCWWFRLRVQDLQNKNQNPFTKHKEDSTLTISYFDLCRQLDYGERTIKAHRNRIFQTLSDGIAISQDLGYINSFSFDSESDMYSFDLNIDYYPNQYRQETPEEQENPRPSIKNNRSKRTKRAYFKMKKN